MRVGYRLSRFGGVGLVMGDTKIRGAAMGGKGGTGVRLSFAAGAVRAALGSYLSPAISRTPRVPKSTLSITDNRTGKQYEIAVQDGTVRAVDLRQIKAAERSEEHTSELQSRLHLVCRLLLEKKKRLS